MAEALVTKGNCQAGDCLNLQKFVNDLGVLPLLSETEIEDVETNEIADCMVKNGCAAESYTSGRVALTNMIDTAGALARRVRSQHA